jgi:hypothetical protein
VLFLVDALALTDGTSRTNQSAEVATHTLGAYQTRLTGFVVEDDDFEMDPGAECPFQALEQHRILVEVLTEVRPRFLGVDESDFLSLADETGQNAKEWTLFYV